MVQLGCRCMGTRLSVLLLVFCSILLPLPTDAYIYAVSRIGVLNHIIW